MKGTIIVKTHSLLFVLALMLARFGLAAQPAAAQSKDSPAKQKLSAEEQSQLDEADRLNAESIKLYREGKAEEAIPLVKQALQIRLEIQGEKHADTTRTINNLGALLSEIGDYAAARPYYEQALSIRKAVYGEKHASTATSLANLGFLHKATGDYAAAREHYEQALAIRREVLGDKHADTASSLNNLGQLHRELGEYPAARKCYDEALSIKLEILGEKHRDTALSQDSMGVLLLEMGEYAAAQPYFEQALATRREVLGGKHPETARTVNNMGYLLKTLGDHSAARSYYEEALSIFREVLGEQHPETAEQLNNLGALLDEMGDYPAAREYYEQSLQIHRKVFGEKHPNTTTSLNNLAILLDAIGDKATARRYFEQVLATRTETLGGKHPDTATSLKNLAALLAEEGELAAAQPYYERALAIRREVLGENNADTAGSFHGMGYLLGAQGDYAAARWHYERALAIRKSVFGSKHHSVAAALSSLGALLDEQGDLAAARQFYEESLEIRSEVLGDRHPDTAWAHHNLAGLLAKKEDWAGVARHQDQARRAVRRHAARVLPGLSPKEQVSFLQHTDLGAWHMSLTLGWMRRHDAHFRELSAGWLMNGKGQAQEALAQQTLLARDSRNPAQAAKVRELLAVRRQLGTLSMAAPKPGEEEQRRGALAKLEQQEQELARHLGGQAGQPLQEGDWAEVDQVRNALPADAVFIDFARFETFDFNATGKGKKWRPARYVAWVVPAADKGAVRTVDLGEAEAIDQIVRQFRERIVRAAGTSAEPGEISKLGEPEAEQEIQKELQELARLVLAPLLEHLADAKELALSPDGALWLVPWGALPLNADQYAVEKYNIRYVVSGRDLVGSKFSAGKQNEPVILADPNFDLSPQDVDAAGRAVLRSAYEPPAGASQPTSGEASKLPQVGRLPGTAAEAKAIAPRLQKYVGKKPLVYSNEYALESVLKKVARPKVAILSTHGFFLPDQVVARNETVDPSGETRSLALSSDGKPIENPLMRCGLLLAGCNQSGGAAGGDDGILTGLEIVGTDLRGTELVVLSACETGLGEVRNGQGVAGLRQAFQLAGAQAVVSTLWQIPDRESAQLVVRFFDNLAAGKSKSNALRDAQLSMIQSRREKNGAAHPFFWAAYTLTGN